MTTLGSHLVLSSAFLSETQYDAMALGIIFPFQLGHKEKGQYQVQGVLPTQTGFCSCTIDQNIIRNHLQLRKTKAVTSVFAFFGGDFLIKTVHVNIISLVLICYVYVSILSPIITPGGILAWGLLTGTG